ncbi:MAG: acyl-CoA dehydrogenase, partial [Henriciella sp.]
SLGVQVHGGMGYIEETGAAQFLRDVRITPIYEGTNGIQALDLVGRKLAADGGRAIFSFFAEIDDFIGTHDDNAELKVFLDGLREVKAQLVDGTQWLMKNGMSDFNNAAAASTDYLQLFGLTALSFMWARMAELALRKRGSDPFYDDKLITGRYFVARILPEGASHLVKLKTGAAPIMALADDRF